MRAKIYFHTNVPAPYRKHQFEMITKKFPNSLIYLTSIKQASYRPWESTIDGWNANILVATPARRILNLLIQPWGSVHVCAYAGGLLYWVLLMLSGMIGHSVVLGWSDGNTKLQVEERRRMKIRRLSLKHRFLHWLGRKGKRGIFVSGKNGAEIARIEGYGEDEIVNAYLSHDVDHFVEFREKFGIESRRRIREKLGMDESKIGILNISRFLPWKRLEDVSKALLILENKHPDLARKCEFTLIGDGDCRDHEQYLARLEKVKVHHIMQMPPEEVLSYYCASDIFAFPSEGDIWGLVVNEALSMGLPVICTDVIGAAELVRDGENGYVVPPRCPEAMAEKIAMLCDGQRLKQFSEEAMNIKDTWRTDFGLNCLAKFIVERK